METQRGRRTFYRSRIGACAHFSRPYRRGFRRNGKVAASINAREIVVMGKVRGNVSATDRVDIRAEGALTGDVAAARISIEDGAFFKGGIDIRKLEPRSAAPGIAVMATHEAPKLAHS